MKHNPRGGNRVETRLQCNSSLSLLNFLRWQNHLLLPFLYLLIYPSLINNPEDMGMPGQLAALLGLVTFLPSAFCFSVAGQDGTCEANGFVYYVGEWYFLDSENCTQCECTAEGAMCVQTECTALPAACIHVSHYPSDCCPRCERIGCEHNGEVYELGQSFQPSDCETCICDIDGKAICAIADCTPPACVNPVFQKGECCPQCKDGPNCYVDDTKTQIIPEGEAVWVDSCTQCQCHDWQDGGYWRGNRVATCVRIDHCRVSKGKV